LPPINDTPAVDGVRMIRFERGNDALPGAGSSQLSGGGGGGGVDVSWTPALWCYAI